MNFDRLVRMINEYDEYIRSDSFNEDNDYPEYIFECACESVMGPNVWKRWEWADKERTEREMDAIIKTIKGE